MAANDVIDVDGLLRDGAIRLELTDGLPTWEASTSLRHQLTIDLIRTSIEPSVVSSDGDGCKCLHYSDISIQFPDGSYKRPDIAIFCEQPPIKDMALIVLPCAVIEIISPGYEYKDLSLNPPFYLSQGLLDVVIVEPRTGQITHYSTAQIANYSAPVTLTLQCGCRCTLPTLTAP